MFSKTKVIIALILLTFTAASANAARYIGFNVTEIHEDDELVETRYSHYDVGDDSDGYIRITSSTYKYQYIGGVISWIESDQVWVDTDGVSFIMHSITFYPEREHSGYWIKTYPDGTVESGTF